MTFLNPFVLFGLAAAAIPILIHLFNVRKLRTIDFSTLTFLKELNKKKIRRIKVRQWILLALRTILILLIVLAFSRPALQGSFVSSGARAASTVVIILDDTPSMDLHDVRGRYLTRAQQKALEIVAAMEEQDDAILLRLSDLPDATVEEPVRDISRLTSLINETEVRSRHRTMEEALRLSSRLLQQSRNLNKEVYLITDGQRSSVVSSAPASDAADALFGPTVKFFYVPLRSGPGENVAVERVTIPPSLMHVGKPFTLSVAVKNHGPSPVSNHLVTVTLDRAMVMQKSVSLGGGESATLEFSLLPPHAGLISGFVESEDDPFIEDNRYYFSLTVPQRISVAVVAADPRHSRYITAALSAAKAVNPSSPVVVSELSPSRMTTAALAQQDVVILAGVTDLPSGLRDIVVQYLSKGGTALFFPSSDSLSGSPKYLSAFGVPELTYSRSSASFGTIDHQFPVFQGMFESSAPKDAGRFESPQITATRAPARSAAVRPVITLSDGSVFLWFRESGKGKMLGFSVPATTDWSDFPMKGIFVPLLFQSVVYLASPLSTAEDLRHVAGEPLEFSTTQWKRQQSISAAMVQCIDPEQRIIPMQSSPRGGTSGSPQTVFTAEGTDAVGIYRAAVGTDTMALFAVNLDRRESEGSIADDADLSALRNRLGIPQQSMNTLTPESDLQQAVTESRFGIELWRYVLLAALLIAMIEMIIAREPKQE